MKRVLILVLLLLLCAPTALAAPSLDAQLTDGNLYITWSGCNCPEAILTVYRDNWPVLVTCVCGVDGEYAVPAWYTQTAGLYAAQLRCNEGCIRVEAGSTKPTAEPTAQPTPAPTTALTVEPTVEPTAVPAVEPTPQATPSPTVEPTATSTPAPTVTATPLPTARPTPQPTEVPTMQPTRRPTDAPTQAAGTTVSSLADEVIRQVNMERSSRGLGELTVDAELTRAAAVRAQEIVENFSHTRPDGSSWSTVSSAASGENIAMGHDSADRVMAAWMSSEGHRENILRASYTRIGVCAYESGGVLYWVQLFGR